MEENYSREGLAAKAKMADGRIQRTDFRDKTNGEPLSGSP
jgi:hypothetical protein